MGRIKAAVVAALIMSLGLLSSCGPGADLMKACVNGMRRCITNYETAIDADTMVLIDDYLYIAEADYSESGTIEIVDVSDPTSPVHAGQFDIPSGNINKLLMNYNRILVGGSNLYIYNTESDPIHPELIGALDEAQVSDMDVAGGIVVTSSRGDIEILTLSDPANPVTLGSLTTPGYTKGVSIRDDYVYLGSGDAGALIVDISELSNPTLVGTYLTTTPVLDVLTYGDESLCVLDSEGIILLNVADPTEPVLMESKDIGGTTLINFDYSNTIFIAGNCDGLVELAMGSSSMDFSSYFPAPVPYGEYSRSPWDVKVESNLDYLLVGYGELGLFVFWNGAESEIE